MGTNPASKFGKEFEGDNKPVTNVSWYDARAFCQAVSQMTGKAYRLPSEAEWEYACRAGTMTPFHFGETITTELANHDKCPSTSNHRSREGYRETTTDVGIFPANDWGLHDMHGNVLEWCEDDWHRNYKGAPNDGSAWVDRWLSRDRNNPETCGCHYSYTYGADRLARGGCWFYSGNFCRSATRYKDYPSGGRLSLIGFRVCCGF